MLDVIEVDENNRIVVDYDDAYGENPRTDWDGEPGHMFYTYGERGRIHPDGTETDYEYAYRYFAEREGGFAPDVFERWLRINFGTAYVETLRIDRGADALVYVTSEDLAEYGWDGWTEEEIRTALRGALETYRAWANGEVYALRHERRVHWVSTEGVPLSMETWETVDSIGGVYLNENYTVRDVVKDHFDVTLPEEG